MLEFMQKKNISVVWSNGREKVFGKGPNFDHWNNPALIQSMKDAIKRAPNAQGTRAIQNIVNDLEANGRSVSLARIGKVSGNAAGHTLDGAGFVVMKQASRHVPIKAREVARTKEAVLRSVEMPQPDDQSSLPTLTFTASLAKLLSARKMAGWLPWCMRLATKSISTLASLQSCKALKRQTPASVLTSCLDCSWS